MDDVRFMVSMSSDNKHGYVGVSLDMVWRVPTAT